MTMNFHLLVKLHVCSDRLLKLHHSVKQVTWFKFILLQHLIKQLRLDDSDHDNTSQPYNMKATLLTIILCVYESKILVCGDFSPKKAIKLADYMRVMIRYPKYEYLPHIRKCLHMYAGILSYLTLQLEEEPDDSSVEDFFLFGPPRFMTMPIRDKRKQDLKKTYKWGDRDLRIFLEELNDAKKVWREFSRTMLSKKSHISAEPVPQNSLFIE